MMVKGWAASVLLAAVAVLAVSEGAIIITAGPVPSGHAEVQNMMRNPEQRATCRPGHIRQIITHDNCDSQEMENQVCAGSCFSYSLPQTEPETTGDEALAFCESCQPSHSNWINISLECKADDQSTYEVSKSVQQITNCSCTACPGTPGYYHVVNSQDDPSYDGNHRISELLNRALPPQQDIALEPVSSPANSPYLSLPPALSILAAANTAARDAVESSTPDFEARPPVTSVPPPTATTEGTVTVDAVIPADEDSSADTLSSRDEGSSLDTMSINQGEADSGLVSEVGASVDSALVSDTDMSVNIGLVSDADSPVSIDTVLLSDADENSLPEDRESSKGPPYYDVTGPQMLRGISQQHPPEAERNPNSISFNSLSEGGVSEELSSDDPDTPMVPFMHSINALLRGEGPVKYEQLSLNELRSVMQALDPDKANEISGKSIYMAKTATDDNDNGLL